MWTARERIQSNPSNDNRITKPEYTKYPSPKHFFNAKRLALLSLVPEKSAFRERVNPNSFGELVSPPPTTVQEHELSGSAITQTKKRWQIKGRDRKSDPTTPYLRVNQVRAMCTVRPTTPTQISEYRKAIPKMKSDLKRFSGKETLGKRRRIQQRREGG